MKIEEDSRLLRRKIEDKSLSADDKRTRLLSFIFFYLLLSPSISFFPTEVSAQSRSEWRDSLETLSASLRQDPDNIDLRLRKAEADIQLEQWDYALAEYGRILRADERNLAALFFRAYVLNRIVQMFPDSADAYAARAAFETKYLQYELAVYDWGEAVRLRPENEGFVISKVDLLIRLKRKKEAREALDALVARGTPRGTLKEWYDRTK